MKKPRIKTYSALKSRVLFDVLDDVSLLFRSRTVGEINNGIAVDLVERYRIEESTETTGEGEEQTTSTTYTTIIDRYDCTISKFDMYEIEFTGSADIFFYLVLLQDEISVDEDYIVSLTYDGSTFDGVKPGSAYNDSVISFTIPKVEYTSGDQINIRVHSVIEEFTSTSIVGLASTITTDSKLVDLRQFALLDINSLPQGDTVVLSKPGTLVTPSDTETTDGIWTIRTYNRVTLQGAEGLPETPSREYTGLYRTVIHINYSEDRGPFRIVNSIYKWNNGTWTK